MVRRVLRWSLHSVLDEPMKRARHRLFRLVRTVFVLGVLVAIGILLWRLLTREDEAPSEPTSEKPPSDEPPKVPAEDGACPATHPIKATDGSEVFHSPGGAFYERTHADACYRDAAAAESDSLRASKR